MKAALEQCFNCDRKIGRLEQANLWDGQVVCDDCLAKLSRPKHRSSDEPIVQKTGERPQRVPESSAAPQPPKEKTLLTTRQSMRGPLLGVIFLVSLPSYLWGPPALIISLVICLPCLLVSFVGRSSRSLTITTRRTIMRSGILGSHSNEVLHNHIRNIQISQGVFQSLIGTGTLAISSAGQSNMEIVFRHLSRPGRAKRLIDQHRYG